jgi:hypothetical protein
VRLVILASIAFVAVAHAGPEAGTRLAAEADALAADGKLVEAAEKYRAAFAEDARPEHVCNAGVAYYKAVDLVRAHHYLDRCVAIGAALDRAFIANVRTVLTAVEDALAKGEFTPVDFHVEPSSATATFAGGPFGEPIVATGRVWLAPNRYALTLRADGFVDRRVDIDATRAHEVVDVGEKLERVAPPPRVEQPPPAPPIRPTTKATWKALAIGVSAGTAGMGATALVFYLVALGKADAASKEQIDHANYDRLVNDAHAFQHISWGFGAATAVGALASAYLWYRAARVVVAPSHDGAAIAVSGRF